MGLFSSNGGEDDDQSSREEAKEAQKSHIEDREGQLNTQMGRSVKTSEKDNRSPKTLVEQAEGDIKLKHLKDTSGRVTPWLDKPIIDYLKQDEQPEFIFAGLNAELEFEYPDGTSGEIGYSAGARFLVITDQRIFFVNGAGVSNDLEDEILVRKYDNIDKIGAEDGWLSDGIGFVDEDGVEFRFGVTGNTDLDDAIEYVDERVHTHREVDPEIQKLVANAEGETVTYEALAEHPVVPVLDDDEQPHHLLEGNALLVEGGDGVSKKGGAADSLVTIATNKRVLCNIHGKGIINIPYDSIISVEYGLPPEDEWEVSIPLLGDFSGQTEKLIIHSQGRTYYFDLSERLGILPDSVVEQDDEEHSEFVFDVINFIRTKREEFKNQSHSSESKTTESDPLDQIERLKELNEQGAITDDEYQKKKADLLDQV